MIVDDVKDNRLTLSMILEDDFDIYEAESGSDCLQCIGDIEPDILLLDVNMPEMNGYEVCVALRKQPKYAALPIIFVSAADTTEERLAGFEAGGDEYVTKPVDGTTLINKVKFRLEHRQEVINAKNDASQAMNIAMEAMTSSSELGQIINFVKEANDVKTLEQMGNKLHEVTGEFTLRACILVKNATPSFFGCNAGSLESQVLERSMLSNERVINLGIRTIVKGDYVSLLIKNMPIDDEARHGRLKDHLAVLVSIADGRLAALSASLEQIGERSALIDQVIQHTEQKINLINDKFSAYDSEVRDIMSVFVAELESKLFRLGLEEDQEEALVELAYDASRKLNEANKSKGEVEQSLQMVVESLYKVKEAH